MSYDFTIRSDEGFSQFEPLSRLAAFLTKQPHVKRNGTGDASFVLEHGALRMQMDAGTVDQEHAAMAPPHFNCIEVSVPSSSLVRHPQRRYLPLLRAIAQHFAWELYDEQLGENLPLQPWWKLW